MKVLLIVNAHYVHGRRWAAGLARAGVEVVVFSRKAAPIHGARLIRNDVPPWAPWRARSWVERKRGLLRRVLREVKPDVVNVQAVGPYSVFPEDLDGVPLVVSTTGSDVIPLKRETHDKVERKRAILNAADRVVASSRYLAQATCRYAGWSDPRVLVNFWGVDLHAFTPPRRPSEEPVVGFVKALRPHYGPDVLLEAFAQVRNAVPDARLRMAGCGDMEPSLKKRAGELGIASHVEWVGLVDYARVPGLFARMSVSAMPSTHEALGMAALESQAMKVPVVASQIGGLPETVLHEETGILVPPRDLEALAEGIVRILSDRQWRRELGERGRQYVEQHFDWSDTLDRMVGIYEEVMAGTKAENAAQAVAPAR
jgi:glycosyltransferase involved in cell wall biosynthesis